MDVFKFDFEIFRGDDFKFNFTATYKNGEKFKFISGDKLLVIIKHRFFETVKVCEESNITSDTYGKEILIPHSKMINCESGAHTLQIKLKRGNLIKTITDLNINIKPSEVIEDV